MNARQALVIRRVDGHGHRIRREEPTKIFTDEEATIFNIRNAEKLNKCFDDSNFHPTKKENYIASIYLVGTRTQYANFPKVPNILLLKKWAESLKANGLKGIIFHNCFRDVDISKLGDVPIEWIRVVIPPAHMSGLYRFFIYDCFMEKYEKFIDNIFYVDSTDLTVLKNPFIQENYKTDKIYIGYESVVCGNKWMIMASKGYDKYHALVKSDIDFANSVLLNNGIVGGKLEAIREFVKKFAFECSKLYPMSGVQDMCVLNYLAYKEFRDKVEFGTHVNSLFTKWEKDNKTAWFQHK